MTERTTFIVLKTAGSSVPKLDRAPPAHAIVRGEDIIHVDCCEGASSLLRRAGSDLQHVHHIQLSHHHFDHISSLFAGLGLSSVLPTKSVLQTTSCCIAGNLIFLGLWAYPFVCADRSMRLRLQK